MSDTGARAFSLACALCGLPADPDELKHRFAPAGEFGLPEMMRAAKAYGLKVKWRSPLIELLGKSPLPAIAWSKDGEFFVVAKADVGSDGAVRQFLIQRPGGRPEALA